MNQVTIVGRITQNPDLKETGNGKKVLNFTVAVNEKLGKKMLQHLFVVRHGGKQQKPFPIIL